MHVNLTLPTSRRTSVVAKILAALALSGAASWCSAGNAAAPGADNDGWQVLSAATPTAPSSPAPSPAVPVIGDAPAAAMTASASASTASLAVTPVVVAGTPSAPAGDLTLRVSPQDINLRNALDRWLQTQGWQLAWKIDDDLPLEFNATFTGSFTSVLIQVMRATNHMRTPTRICRHTNNVIRVVARAANCQD